MVVMKVAQTAGLMDSQKVVKTVGLTVVKRVGQKAVLKVDLMELTAVNGMAERMVG